MPLPVGARGIVRVNLDLKNRHEQSGRRPAIVLSWQLLVNGQGWRVICPITSNERTAV